MMSRAKKARIITRVQMTVSNFWSCMASPSRGGNLGAKPSLNCFAVRWIVIRIRLFRA